MAKKNSISYWKKQAWDQFSRFIRLRDRLEENGYPTEFATCCTCKKVAPWRSLQAGHFVAGRRNVILFDERNCHAQCYGCNCGRSGHVIEYYPFMIEKYGQEVIDELKYLHDNEQRSFSIEELMEMTAEYRAKADELLAK
jgi:hypothetical protein